MGSPTKAQADNASGDAETRLSLVRRALKTLRAGRRLIGRCDNENQLLQGICDLLVETGKYRLAWVGRSMADESCSVEPVASSGFEDGYLDNIRISWADDEWGQGPTGRAIRECRMVVVQDMLTDTAFKPWRDEANQRDYQSSAAIPMMLEGQCIGTLQVYASEPQAFSEEESALLHVLVDELSGAIQAFRSNTAREKAEQDLLTILNHLPDAFYRTNLSGEVVLASQSVQDLLGYTVEEFIGSKLADLYVDPKGRDDFIEKLTANNGVVIGYEAPLHRKDGSIVWVSTSAHYYRDADGNIAGVEGTTRDITARKQHDTMMQQAAAVFENTADAVVIRDKDLKVVDINRAFTEITGYSHDEAIGRDITLLRPEGQNQALYDDLLGSLRETGRWQGEMIHRCKDGRLIPAWQTSSTVKDESGQITHYVSTFSDITPLKRTQQQLDHLAHHDPLTGLPNRLVFQDMLSHAIEQSKRNRERLAVMFLDLDRFKNINDSFGHPVGDRLLEQVAARLKATVREEDTIARLGGDEFIILLEKIDSPQAPALLARKLIAAFEAPFDLQDHAFQITLSMGISLFPNDGADVATLIKNADAAMYRAKDEGRNDFQFYTSELTVAAFERLTLETALRRALEREEFRVYYQPQVDMESGRLLGAEALIRWAHPDMGLIPPDKFIPLAEEAGLIIPMGEWVLCNTCQQLAEWDRQGMHLPRVGVNISAAQIQKADLALRVAGCLEAADLEGNRLELEITEGFIMHRPEHAVKTLEGLRDLEVHIAIDDFGTGYSSLSHLKQLPIDKLKIDRSFVRDIPDDANDEAITLAIIAMAKSLNLQVIAEGVETEQQRTFLQEHGCHEGQGYLYARPLPAEEFAANWLTGKS